ncbi:hypothetical protein D778_00307 [Xanthomarina gelatinilytica]|uniref:DUF3078 domain-containing protein n=1 Tax=Xanthomarina gelatinilytica TaxID=1137281 RepID=M7MFD1_9FLAO|nr:DUF3078 domain-containing protein [Xanthomarina gelatinilytica]EMQ94947.1 hypothetical protein D778_00307 [Xanthomarina gelatinilytica]
MKKFLFIVSFISCQFVFSQPDSLFFKTEDITIPKWTHKNKASALISEVAFVNWNAGGSNSISALFNFESILKYRYKHLIWQSILISRYGINKQENQGLRKTDDILDVSSTLGYKKNEYSNWFFSSRFNFKTQFTKGYNYPDDTNVLSRFMAPGYLFIGGGMEYGKNIEELSIYFSPLTMKTTFVLDDKLANAGSFGVAPAVYDDEGNLVQKGERVRNEIGILLTSVYEREIFQNVLLSNYVSFYTDYLNEFGNIDVDWQINFDFKVNSFIKANFGSHLKYDNDVKTIVETDVEGDYETVGALVQWKQILGVGVVVDF